MVRKKLICMMEAIVSQVRGSVVTSNDSVSALSVVMKQCFHV